MSYWFVLLIAFSTAALALLSGFGLGTVLTPVFLFFYDAKSAVFLVAIVHLLNNLLKLGLFQKHIDFGILKRFGILAIVGSFIGAWGQIYVANQTLQKLIGVILIFLGVKEWLPSRLSFRFPKAIDPVGGFFSGLLGGLVGKQGAIRSSFLLNYDISKETFLATGIVIACAIDFVRIPIYWISYGDLFSHSWPFLTILIAVTFAGTLVGKWLLARFSPRAFKHWISAAIILMGIHLLF